MVWYSHLFQNFPQFVVIHKVKGFGVVNKAKADVFLELSCFFDGPTDVGNLISGSSAYPKSSLNIWKQQLELDMEQKTGSKSETKYVKAVYCHPAYLTYMQNTSCKMLNEAQAGIKIARRNTKNLRYAEDTTFMAKSKEELKKLLIKVKEESGKKLV